MQSINPIRFSLAVPCVLLALAAALAAAQETKPATPPAERPAPTTQKSTVPAELVGDWFWGNVSLARYVDRNTGDFLGNAHSGALTYAFAADGTYKRYFYLEVRPGGDVSGIFSASEGTVTFTGDSFTLRPTKGTYRFTEGCSKKREREMRQDELERPGLTFAWRLEKKAKDKPADLIVGKPGEDPHTFRRSKD